MKIIEFLINSKIYISLAALLLTLETQILLGLKLEYHPYLVIIFFSTLLEYNLYRLHLIVYEKEKLNSIENNWLNRNLTFFIILISVSLISIIYFSILASREVKFILIPLSIVTLFYSFPFLKYNSNLIFKLREIPYLKIFIISLIWSIVTVVIPVIRAETHIEASKIMLIMIERFLFIFAITIPFDIRDIETDKKAGMRTIPILFNERKSITISNLVIGVFLIITTIHFIEYKILSLFIALVISGLSTLYILNSIKIKKNKYYHFGILDGTMILQFILIYLFRLFLK